MKTYVITLSQKFPAKHPRKGEPTNFNAQLLNAVWRSHNMSVGFPQFGMKLHTVRNNFELWSKRFKQIDAGKAILSIRYWTGKPYHSKQMEICKLTKKDGIGLQPIYIEEIQNLGKNDMEMLLRVAGGYDISRCIYDHGQIQDPIVDGKTMAKNDGLSLRDWFPFFSGHNLSKPLAIIHFTPFRY